MSGLQFLPPRRAPRWGALPSIAGYYLLGAVLVPTAFVGWQVGLERLHPTHRDVAPRHDEPREAAPAPRVLPIDSPEYLAMLRAEIDKAVRAAVKQETSPIHQELASLNAEVAHANEVKTLAPSAEDWLKTGLYAPSKLAKTDDDKPYMFSTGDSKWFSTIDKTSDPGKSTFDMSSITKDLGSLSQSVTRPAPNVYVIMMKSGKSVTIVSDDAAALKEARDKILSR